MSLFMVFLLVLGTDFVLLMAEYLFCSEFLYYKNGRKRWKDFDLSFHRIFSMINLTSFTALVYDFNYSILLFMIFTSSSACRMASLILSGSSRSIIKNSV